MYWWDASDKCCDHISIKTDWVYKSDKVPPEFDLEFPIPSGATDYLIVLGQFLGKNDVELGVMPSKSMKIMTAGCFKPTGKKLLLYKEMARQKVKELEQNERAKKKGMEREEVRVKRKN